jgi:hypothetical protein
MYVGGRCRLEPEIPARETGTAGPHVFNGFGIHSTNRTSNTALIDESLAPTASLPASFAHQNGRRWSPLRPFSAEERAPRGRARVQFVQARTRAGRGLWHAAARAETGAPHRIAETLESTFIEITENQPELLARHFTEAGLIETAALLWGKAGQRSLARSALIEGVSQLGKALGQIATLPGSATLRREQIRLQVALANALMHVKGYAAPDTVDVEA